MITYFSFWIIIYLESLWTRFSEKPWHLLAFWYLHNLQVIFFIQNLIICWIVKVKKIFSNHFYYLWKIYLKIFSLFYIQNWINCWTCVLICNRICSDVNSTSFSWDLEFECIMFSSQPWKMYLIQDIYTRINGWTISFSCVRLYLGVIPLSIQAINFYLL